MNLYDLKEQVANAVDFAMECAVSLEDIDVYIQFELGPHVLFTPEVELHYDNNAQASGCVLVGHMQF